MKLVQLFKLLSTLTLVLLFQGLNAQGVTTASMNGRITSTNGEPLIGANIFVVHTPSGTTYGNSTDFDGFYRLLNMRVGGPYKVTISYTGFQDFVKEDIFLQLGQAFQLNTVLAETAVQLGAVEVVASRNNVFDGNRSGAETVVGEEQINTSPTVARDLTDFTRLTPQASISDPGDGPSISIAGSNNRFNSIFIDGAVNNDVFGLADQGTNGGQAGVSPISIDAIEQFQVVISPFDVRQGGFSGGGINAVTRSGSNNFEGSAYYFFRNESLAGKTPTDNESAERTRLSDFSAKTFGFRIGGPIIKNKLFFFANFERVDEITPQPFDFSTYTGNLTQSEIENLGSFVENTYGYNPGTFLDNPQVRDGNKYLLKLDWNINQNHKLTIRHSYNEAEFFRRSRSSTRTINFSKNNAFFPHSTNSSSIELKSIFGSNLSNNLILGFTSVRDDRDPEGDPFPRVRIRDGGATIRFGSELFSTANELNQDVFTITDNLSLFKGKHTITIGTHNEFYKMDNLFIGRNFGYYEYANIDDFLNNNNPIEYRRSYSLLDLKNPSNVGDLSTARAGFNAFQLGLYVQDEIQINERLKITAGIRADLPFFDDPRAFQGFNDSTVAKIEQFYDLRGARSGQGPKTAVLFSPRIGFNLDVNGDKTTQLRGGVGIFTSRLPFVWIGGTYNNTGDQVGSVRLRTSRGQDLSGVFFEPDITQQLTATSPAVGGMDPIPSGQMDLYEENFKLPQVFRTSLALDQKLPWGLIGTLEGIYTKTLNNVLYTNVNLVPPTENFTGTPDNRPRYSGDRIESAYSRDIFLATNTNEGYSYNLTAQIQKPFSNGFTGSLAYTFGRAKALNDGTSSQNSSQWNRHENIRGANDLDLSFSDFDLGSRFIASMAYKLNYSENLATTISLFYNGQSGRRFSYVYGNADITNDNFRNVNLIYVPASASEIVLVESNGVSPEQQWAELDAYISADDYLNSRRGQYAERNGVRSPFEHILDIKVTQDISLLAGQKKHTLQLTLDIFNFTNFLNKNWGRRYFVNGSQFDTFNLIQHEGNDGLVPQFSFSDPGEPWDIDDSGINSSRWQMQFGIRYIFQ